MLLMRLSNSSFFSGTVFPLEHCKTFNCEIFTYFQLNLKPVCQLLACQGFDRLGVARMGGSDLLQD